MSMAASSNEVNMNYQQLFGCWANREALSILQHQLSLAEKLETQHDQPPVILKVVHNQDWDLDLWESSLSSCDWSKLQKEEKEQAEGESYLKLHRSI